VNAEYARSDGSCLEHPHDAWILLETELGTIGLELFGTRAPLTVCNFLRYVIEGRFDGGAFFRTVRPDNQTTAAVKIDVVQANIRDDGKGSFAAIPLERTVTTGLHHDDGTVSMARSTPDSATSSFFVTIGAQPELDFAGRRAPDGQGFAAFGRVSCGMGVVRRIWTHAASGETLTPPITIRSARLVQDAAADVNGSCSAMPNRRDR
jgi:peptidyl-prolyl cis-trans isomerase A (cyclophilin A)